MSFPNKGDGLSEQSVNRFRRKTAPCSKKENKVVVKRWNTKGDVLFFLWLWAFIGKDIWGFGGGVQLFRPTKKADITA